MKKPLLSSHRLCYRLVIGILSLLLVYICLFHDFNSVVISLPRTILQARCENASRNGQVARLCCPKQHPLKLNFPEISSVPTFLELLYEFPSICQGSWEPTDCQVYEKVAIIIPYRDRESHLRLLLHRLHSILPHQNVAYSIFVIEQSGTDPFNRGLLLNIGIRESLQRDPNITCFIFHDVDLLPENSQNIYFCDSTLRHLSSGIDEFRYHVPFSNYAGGVTALSKENVLKINGFPNRYWGWGNEDDELSARCMVNDIKISRTPEYIGLYHAVSHVKASRAAGHYNSFLSFRGYRNDGLSALTNQSYYILGEKRLPPQTSLVPLPQSLNSCALLQLASKLNISIEAIRSVIPKARQLSSISSVHRMDVDRFLGSILYTHLTIDVSPIRTIPVQPIEYTRESLLWFLRFYGWI